MTVATETRPAAADTRRPVDALFEPFVLNGLHLPNRIVMPSMGHGKAPGGVLAPEFEEFFRLRAIGGAGLLFGEASTVPHAVAPGRDDTTHFHGIHSLAMYRRIVDTVHANGNRIIGQLHHKGGTRWAPDAPNPYLPSISPSGLFLPATEDERREVVEAGIAMTQTDIDEVIDAYATAALTAKQLGFDGAEIHAAHGYLIDQFLWHVTNRRTDAYGGAPENRARFAAEIIAECRRRVGPDFPLLIRLSQWKTTDYRAKLAETPQELEKLLRPIADAGIDLIDCSQRRFWQAEFDGSDMNFAGWTKKLSGKPTMTVGSVGLDGEFYHFHSTGLTLKEVGRGADDAKTDAAAQVSARGLDRLIEMLERGDFDLVGVGRGMIANANWPQLVREGRMDELSSYGADSLINSTTFAQYQPSGAPSAASEKGA